MGKAQMTTHAEAMTRPIIGIERRTAQEVFDIMCDRFRSYLEASGEPVALEWLEMPKRLILLMLNGKEVGRVWYFYDCAYGHTWRHTSVVSTGFKVFETEKEARDTLEFATREWLGLHPTQGEKS